MIDYLMAWRDVFQTFSNEAKRFHAITDVPIPKNVPITDVHYYISGYKIETRRAFVRED